MSHFAMTRDEVQVCDWTGDVPRVGETLMATGSGRDDYRGKWEVTRVVWGMNVNVTGPTQAQVSVEPACDHATAWLERERARRAEEA
jgi:hypothetical protein